MLSWLRNLLGTKPAPDPTVSELLVAWVEMQSEWRSFLEQQARLTRRAAKRVRDDSEAAPALEVPITHDKAVIRARAVQSGLFRTRPHREQTG